MGAGSSAARKITVDNPEDGGAVIKITENVVGRLREGAVTVTNRTDSANYGSASESKSSSGVSTSLDYKSPSSDAEGNVLFVSRHIRRQMEDELERNNQHWENRLKILRDSYNKIDDELRREYRAAVAETNRISAATNANGKRSMVESSSSCKMVRDKVIQCYNLNRMQPLACSKEVEKFDQYASGGVSSSPTMLKVE